MAAIAPFGSLEVTLAHSISHVTRPLACVYPQSTIHKLQCAMESLLTTQFSGNWFPSNPRRGTGQRCLSFSLRGPPRALYIACRAAGVEWSEWMRAFGGIEFDLFIDPGCVSFRLDGKDQPLNTIWSETPQVKKSLFTQEQLQAQLMYAPSSKTFAQEIMMQDAEEDNEIFVMINDEIREPVWITPTKAQFPISIPARSDSTSPVSVVSAISSHSRTSSCSSGSSSGFSFSSHGTSGSYGSSTTISMSSTADGEKPTYKLSRRERARQAKVFVDSSKTDVTNYDGGKTTVLTGGVMLGAAPATKPSTTTASVMQKKSNGAAASSWRSIRA